MISVLEVFKLPNVEYRKVLKISPGAYIFQRPKFEGLSFGGAYAWREICVSKSIKVACSGKEINLPCLLCFTLYSRANSKYKPPGGAYIRRGDLTEGFCVTILGGLYLEGLMHGGAYFRDFTVVSAKESNE